MCITTSAILVSLEYGSDSDNIIMTKIRKQKSSSLRYNFDIIKLCLMLGLIIAHNIMLPIFIVLPMGGGSTTSTRESKSPNHVENWSN